MTAPAAELQKALFEALAGDGALTGLLGGAKMFDQAPADARFPYVTLGRTSLYDWSTSTEGGVELLFTLHVWSKARGKKEVFGIMERVKQRLDDAGFALETHRLVSLRFDYGEARYDEDVAVHHGLLRFRAVVETAV
ncbi:MAG: DUF3168 domain-containing protein [Mesorhizobium sp.]